MEAIGMKRFGYDTHDDTARPDHPLRLEEIGKVALIVGVDERHVEHLGFGRGGHRGEGVERWSEDDFHLGGYAGRDEVLAGNLVEFGQ